MARSIGEEFLILSFEFLVGRKPEGTPARLAAEKLLSDVHDRPTAIFAASDVMALELIGVARSRNLRIPQDLSVIGFDDNPINVYSPVKLSTVLQPLAEMGRLGLEHLSQIAAGQMKVPVKITLATRFIERDSVREISPKEQR